MSKLYRCEVEVVLKDPEEMVTLDPIKVYAEFKSGDPREMLTIRALEAALETARAFERFMT